MDNQQELQTESTSLECDDYMAENLGNEDVKAHEKNVGSNPHESGHHPVR